MANYFDQFDVAPAVAPKAPQKSSNYFDQFDAPATDAPLKITVNPARPDVGRGTAAAEGIRSGLTLNFGDELAGITAASPRAASKRGVMTAPSDFIMGLARLGYEYMAGGDEAANAYAARRDEVRATQKDAQEQYPGTYLAGQVGGSIAIPMGGALNAATLPARVGRGAAVGAGVGGLAGAGEGTDAASRTVGGATGATFGAAVGAAAPPIVEGVIRGASAVGTNVANSFRGVRDPEGEAARRTAVALQRDMQADPAATGRLTAQEFTSSPDARIIDMGGETTRALARSAANTSPEGRQALNNTVNDRFEGQADRVSDWFRGAFNYPNAQAQQEAIEQTARAVNTGRYGTAMRDGAAGVWDAELQRIAGAPAIREAAGAAMPSLGNRGVAEGFAAPRQNPLQWDPATGTASPSTLPNGNTRIPDLRFWDQVKRNLDGMIGTAVRAGDNTRVNELTGLRRELVNNLDRLVPSYQQARAGAAHFFGAENALEAGQNFVMAKLANGEARRALAQMSPTERQLFQDGFVSRYIETLNATGDRRSVLNTVANTPEAREKLAIALGPQRANELEARLRIEGIMDLARGAVQGNSTTARQLAELGLAGGTYGIGTGGDVLNPNPSAVVNAAIVYGALRGKARINENVSRQVAQLLTSNDPRLLMRGIQAVVRNQNLFNSLRAADVGLARVGAQQAPAPALQIPSMTRAEGDQPNVPRPPGQ